MNTQSWQAVDLGVTQMPEISALFAQVFGNTMSDALWHWKYDAGRGVATGTRDEDGHLLAHYGGTARALWVDGQAVNAVQLGDVMVAEHARGILSRRGPFATAATAFLQRHIGEPPGFALGFGFPNHRHTRLGEKLGMYRALGNIQELNWASMTLPATSFSTPWITTAALDWSDVRTDERLDRMWLALRDDARDVVIPKRDALWWRHRYANHPDGPYTCFWVSGRLSRKLLGAIAIRPGKCSGADWEILDFLGPVKYLNAMVFAARLLAARGAAGRVTGWFSDSLTERLQGLASSSGASAEIACQYCVTQRRARRTPESIVARQWWLTGGDTDFR